ncbi:DUF4360 domain-containing protein [Lentzea terrae]|uniref:DUF4360 domain-containing protein n=1 Tax=Lentzea terrae TaxID=2200761 RepID=UPI0038CC15DD
MAARFVNSLPPSAVTLLEIREDDHADRDDGSGPHAGRAQPTPAAAPPGKVTIDVVTVNGSGCPAGTTAVATAADNTAFTVTTATTSPRPVPAPIPPTSART